MDREIFSQVKEQMVDDIKARIAEMERDVESRMEEIEDPEKATAWQIRNIHSSEATALAYRKLLDAIENCK